MAYGLDPRLFIENGPADPAAEARSRPLERRLPRLARASTASAGSQSSTAR